jgi:toluene monooxygenase system ferredoxin subunit
MSWHRLCSLDDVWEGDMAAFELGAVRLLVICVAPGDVRVYDARCPHQSWPLETGTLSDGTLTCRAHRWRFDVLSGIGINPKDCRLRAFACRVENDQVHVWLEAPAPAPPENSMEEAHT